MKHYVPFAQLNVINDEYEIKRIFQGNIVIANPKSNAIMTASQPRTTRNPLLLFLLSGLLLFRLAERLLSLLLFHEPPRSTRFAHRDARPERRFVFNSEAFNKPPIMAPISSHFSTVNTKLE